MLSDKGSVYSSIKSYAKLANDASEACEAAAAALRTPISTVSSNWDGASGDAMVQALEAAVIKIRKISTELNALENQMYLRARSIYNNWPEPETDLEP